MAVPSWPNGIPYRPERPTFQPIKPALEPITTSFEGGNQRNRSRPGDNVGIFGQTIWMSSDEYQTFKAWGESTIGRWTGRFTAQVWNGSAYVTKVCQFDKGVAPTAAPLSRAKLAVAMTLRVFDF